MILLCLVMMRENRLIAKILCTRRVCNTDIDTRGSHIDSTAAD